MSTKKTIVLKSCDDVSFEIDETTAKQSGTIANLIEDGFAGVIPLPNVPGKILAKVIEYCKKHAGGDSSDEESLKQWDAEFLKIDQTTMYTLMAAANYLNVKSLVDLTCQTIADAISGMTVPEMRRYLNVESGYTAEEDAQNRKENPWAYE